MISSISEGKDYSTKKTVSVAALLLSHFTVALGTEARTWGSWDSL